MSKQRANTISTEQLTMKELRFLLFGKKICPQCGNKLVKSKDYIYLRGDDPRVNPKGKWKETRHGKVFYVKGEGSLHPRHTVKYIFWDFKCLECGLHFRINDLANEN